MHLVMLLNSLKCSKIILMKINNIIYRLNYVKKNKWSKHKAIQYILYPEALKTLHCAFENMLDGYYDESMMLNRSIYETSLRIVFVGCYPDEWEAIFINRKKKMQFNVAAFVKDHLRIDWESVYKFMSIISHSKAHKNAKKILELTQAGGEHLIGLEYELDIKSLFMALNMIAFNMCLLFHLMVSIFEGDINSDPILEKRADRISKIDQVLLGLIETNPKSGYSARMKDIIKIGKIIRLAEMGGDWQSVAKS